MKCCFTWTGVALGCLIAMTAPSFCGNNPDLPDSSARERAAAIAIEKLGGKIRRDQKLAGKPVVEVQLGETKTGNRDLLLLADLPALCQLDIHETQVTDKGLTDLKHLSRLEVLNLGGLPISDKGLFHLTALPALRQLDLSATNVTDKGLESLQSLPRLEKLRIMNVRRITDQGLNYLAGLRSLRELDLSATGVSDKGLNHLKRLSRLEALELALLPITDQGLSELATFLALRKLDLSGTRITEQGLKRLKKFPRLESLNLAFLPITDQGLKSLALQSGLRAVDLEHTNVTARGLEYLYGQPGLRRLGIWGLPLTDEESQKLRHALPKVSIEQGNGNTAQKRIRKQFDIPESTKLTPETIRAELLAAVPKGSSRSEVVAFLKKSGIGKDRFSYYYPDEESMDEGAIGCRVTFDPASGELVHTHYWIGFLFDGRKRLDHIEVKEWYTGP